MTLIDFGEFKLRFDPKEVRISIDGETIDIGARREDPSKFDDNKIYYNHEDGGTYLGSQIKAMMKANSG